MTRPMPALQGVDKPWVRVQDQRPSVGQRVLTYWPERNPRYVVGRRTAGRTWEVWLARVGVYTGEPELWMAVPMATSENIQPSKAKEKVDA